MLKSLWVHSATGKRTKVLKDLIKQRSCQFCPCFDSGEPSSSKTEPFVTQCKVISKRALDNKYLATDTYFHSKITADIMYNEPRHFVTIFKDYLIFDD